MSGNDSGPGPGRAIFQVLTLTALVDGRPDLSEAHVIAELVELHPRFTSIEDAFELAVQTRVLLDKEGVETTLEQLCAAITTTEDRTLAFQLAARVMFADGKTEGEEAMVLGTLQELFGLSHAQVRATIDDERTRRGTVT